MSRAICATLATAALASAAHAEPRTDPSAGRAVFTGAATPSPTSIEVNPAALGLGTNDEIYFGGTLLVDQTTIAKRTLDLAGNTGNGPTVHDAQLGPAGMAAIVIHYKDSATFGLAIRTRPVEMFPADHSALQYQTLGGGERVSSGIASSSFKLTDELYFGVSLATEHRALHLRYARDTALAAGTGPGGVNSDCNGSPCGVENPYATEIYDVDVRSSLFSLDAVTVNVGLLYAFTKDTYLAVAYHTVPGVDVVENSLTGRMTVTRAPRDGGGTLYGGATVNVEEPASVDAELRAPLPQQLDLHVGFRWEDLSRFGAYDVRGYGSTFPGAAIPEWTERPRGFHDPFALWAGVEQVDRRGIGIANADAWRLGARVGIETPSLDDDQTSPITIDPWSATLDLGAAVRIDEHIVLQATYGLQAYLPVHVTNSAFDPRDQLACMQSNYDYSSLACEAVRDGYAIPTAAGDYHRFEHAFGIALRYKP